MSGNSATIIPTEHNSKHSSSQLVTTLMQNDRRMDVHGIDGLVASGGLADLNSLAVAINGLKVTNDDQHSSQKCSCNGSTMGELFNTCIICILKKNQYKKGKKETLLN